MLDESIEDNAITLSINVDSGNIEESGERIKALAQDTDSIKILSEAADKLIELSRLRFAVKVDSKSIDELIDKINELNGKKVNVIVGVKEEDIKKSIESVIRDRDRFNKGMKDLSKSESIINVSSNVLPSIKTDEDIEKEVKEKSEEWDKQIAGLVSRYFGAKRTAATDEEKILLTDVTKAILRDTKVPKNDFDINEIKHQITAGRIGKDPATYLKEELEKERREAESTYKSVNKKPLELDVESPKISIDDFFADKDSVKKFVEDTFGESGRDFERSVESGIRRTLSGKNLTKKQKGIFGDDINNILDELATKFNVDLPTPQLNEESIVDDSESILNKAISNIQSYGGSGLNIFVNFKTEPQQLDEILGKIETIIKSSPINVKIKTSLVEGEEDYTTKILNNIKELQKENGIKISVGDEPADEESNYDIIANVYTQDFQSLKELVEAGSDYPIRAVGIDSIKSEIEALSNIKIQPSVDLSGLGFIDYVETALVNAIDGSMVGLPKEDAQKPEPAKKSEPPKPKKESPKPKEVKEKPAPTESPKFTKDKLKSLSDADVSKYFDLYNRKIDELEAIPRDLTIEEQGLMSDYVEQWSELSKEIDRRKFEVKKPTKTDVPKQTTPKPKKSGKSLEQLLKLSDVEIYDLWNKSKDKNSDVYKVMAKRGLHDSKLSDDLFDRVADSSDDTIANQLQIFKAIYNDKLKKDISKWTPEDTSDVFTSKILSDYYSAEAYDRELDISAYGIGIDIDKISTLPEDLLTNSLAIIDKQKGTNAGPTNLKSYGNKSLNEIVSKIYTDAINDELERRKSGKREPKQTKSQEKLSNSAKSTVGVDNEKPKAKPKTQTEKLAKSASNPVGVKKKKNVHENYPFDFSLLDVVRISDEKLFESYKSLNDKMDEIDETGVGGELLKSYMSYASILKSEIDKRNDAKKPRGEVIRQAQVDIPDLKKAPEKVETKIDPKKWFADYNSIKSIKHVGKPRLDKLYREATQIFADTQDKDVRESVKHAIDQIDEEFKRRTTTSKTKYYNMAKSGSASISSPPVDKLKKSAGKPIGVNYEEQFGDVRSKYQLFLAQMDKVASHTKEGSPLHNSVLAVGESLDEELNKYAGDASLEKKSVSMGSAIKEATKSLQNIVATHAIGNTQWKSHSTKNALRSSKNAAMKAFTQGAVKPKSQKLPFESGIGVPDPNVYKEYSTTPETPKKKSTPKKKQQPKVEPTVESPEVEPVAEPRRTIGRFLQIENGEMVMPIGMKLDFGKDVDKLLSIRKVISDIKGLNADSEKTKIDISVNITGVEKTLENIQKIKDALNFPKTINIKAKASGTIKDEIKVEEPIAESPVVTSEPIVTPTQTPTATPTPVATPTPKATPAPTATAAPIDPNSPYADLDTDRVKKYASYYAAFDYIRDTLGDASEATKNAADYLRDIIKVGVGFGGGDELKKLYKATRFFHESDEKEDIEIDKKTVLKELIVSSVSKFATGMIKGIIGKFTGMFMSIGNKALSIISDTIRKSIMLAINPFKKSVQLFSNAVKKAGGKSKILGSLSELFLMPLVLAVEFTLLPVIKKMVPAIKNVTNWVVASKDKFSQLGKVISVVINKVYTMITGNFVYSIENIFKKLDEMSTWIDEEYNKTNDDFFGMLKTAGSDLSAVSSSLEIISQTAGLANEELISLAKDGKLGTLGNIIVNELINAVGTSVKTSLKTAAGLAENKDFNLSQILANILTQAVESVTISTELVGNLLDKLFTAISGVMDTNSEYFDKISKNIQEIIKGVMNIIRDVVGQDWFKDIIFSILNETKEIWLSMLAAQGIASGVGEAAGAGIKLVAGKVLTTGGTVAAGAAGGAATGKVLSKAAEKAEAAKIAKTLQTPASKVVATTGTKVATSSVLKSIIGPIGWLALGGEMIASGIDQAVKNSNVKGTETVSEYLENMNGGTAGLLTAAVFQSEINKVIDATGMSEDTVGRLSMGDFRSIMDRIGTGDQKKIDEWMEAASGLYGFDLQQSLSDISDEINSISDDKSSLDLNITNNISIDKYGNVTQNTINNNPFGWIMNIFSHNNITGA